MSKQKHQAKKAARKALKAEHKASHKAARHRKTAAIQAAGTASELSDQPPLIVLAGATMLAGAVLRKPKMLCGGAQMLASHLIATGIKSMLKKNIVRTRPARAIATGVRRFETGEKDDHDFNSFPSGHTAGAVAVAQASAHQFPTTAVPAKIAAIAAGAIQVPRGKHYPSDVLVGAAIGWISERIAAAAIRRVEMIATKAGPQSLMRKRAPTSEERAPQR